ncbi:MAG TPA: nitroreductase family protein [Gaiellaceae bacterium]|nr:nitroreductase family protein [Gaiellaceae bacterium]
MTNWDGDVARRFHARTNHSWESVRRGGRALDWRDKPHPYKEHPQLEPKPLPPELDRLLRLGAGVVRTRHGYDFRSYSSAGALYPVEIYAATAAGLFSFHARDCALVQLRSEDVRRALAEAAVAPELARAGAVLVLTGILWRTAWKYEARGYRHLWWDAGTMLANLFALEPAARVYTGFVDDRVNRLVGADGEREAALAVVGVGSGEDAASPGTLDPLEHEAAPLSAGERAYPDAYELHAASALQSEDDVRRYRAASAAASAPAPLRIDDLERVLRRRGSTRDFSQRPVARVELAALLDYALAAIPADVQPQTRIDVVAHAVDGLEPGIYRYPSRDTFELVRAGNLRQRVGYLVLEQELGERAAAVLFVLADLDRVLTAFGNRGYRAAQLEGGIRLGRIYLAATARAWGATGTTFYDEDISRALQTGAAPMTAAAVGHR